MEKAYEAWKTDETPENMAAFLEKADPVIGSAIRSYGGGNQILRSRAKLLVAKAAKTFDPKKGVKLHTYLMSQLQPLSRIGRERSQITKIPERVTLDLYRIQEERRKFEDKFGRSPSSGEISDAVGLSRRRMAHVEKFSRGEIPESAVSSEESDFLPGTSKPDPDLILLEYLHHDLDPIDQTILEHRAGIYGKPVLSNEKIASMLKLSPGAVSQRAKKLAEKIDAVRNAGASLDF